MMMPNIVLVATFLLITGGVWIAANRLIAASDPSPTDNEGGQPIGGSPEVKLPSPGDLIGSQALLAVNGAIEAGFEMEGEAHDFQLDQFALVDQQGIPTGGLTLGFRSPSLDRLIIYIEGWGDLVEERAFSGATTTIMSLEGTSFSTTAGECSVSEVSGVMTPVAGSMYRIDGQQLALVANLAVAGELYCEDLSAAGDTNVVITVQVSFRKELEVLKTPPS